MSEKGVRQCAAGTVLFREGEEGNRMYVIKSGSVRLTKRIHDTEVVVEDLGAGEFCGELAMLGEPRRPVSAVVTEDASVIQVDTEQFEGMIKGNSDIALRMLKKLTQRLTQAQYRVSNLVLRTNKARVLHQLRAETQRVKRVEGAGESAPIPANLADVLALEIGEVKQILNELVRDELILIDRRGYFEILDCEAYDRYLRYLELQDRFAFH
ncbi:Crp/Fnr family transcriptional regulator [Lujinxingia vulgaris]|uniref:Crp/Fnr family transcriptional regulator n=1 Tax=Lujinxingia vulgaris TaxID=2600176 RepID=A0A5C6XI39_9DELT|nr:Crp/Fnr family transcriptional regulator [Lujinxingia vulgaris]TXD37792.1 Crp/Fnr family transcriptional regulator [Lujinxingia vulgaris]